MRSFPILLLTALAAALPASAGAIPQAQDIAHEAASAAVAACAALGFRTMATVVDSSGRPVSAVVADPQLARRLAYDSVHSAQIAAYFHDRSGNIPIRIMEDADVFNAVRGHPQLSPLKPGGVPFPGPQTLGAIGVAGPANSDQLGAIGVAGAPQDGDQYSATGVIGSPYGDQDERCARAGVLAVLQKLN